MSKTAAASFLNVYSEKQGSKNLAALLSSAPFLLLTALYFLCYGLLNLDAQSVDVRDMFDDFRLTLPACSSLHWWGNASAAQLPPPEIAAGSVAAELLKRTQVISDGLGDPRSFFISGRRLAMYLPNTQSAYTSFAGPVLARSGSGGTTALWTAAGGWTLPSLQLSVFISISGANASSADVPRSQRFSRIITRETASGSQSFAAADIDVPLVALQQDAWGTDLRAYALSDVWVEISYESPSSLPRLVRVSSKYQPQPLVTVPAAAASASSFSFELSGLDSLSFTAHVADINQPRPFVPDFAFSFQWVVAGGVLVLLALLLFMLWLYLRCWVVVNNVRANTGSLPICFASMPEYRGW